MTVEHNPWRRPLAMRSLPPAYVLATLISGCAASGSAPMALGVAGDLSSVRRTVAGRDGVPGPKGFSVIWQLGTSSLGSGAAGGVALDKAGDLFGAASGGGTNGDGTVYELSPAGKAYTGTVVHNFTGADGSGPAWGTPLIDTRGDLYVTASGGGASGDGTAVDLSPSESGYAETNLFSFGGSDGSEPYAGLTAFKGKTLYTLTDAGGATGHGAIVALTPSGFSERTVYSFAGPPSDGAAPVASLVADGKGALYGVTQYGGPHSGGVVFKFVPSGNGGTETVLWADGQAPPIVDADGNLYGTTQGGGAYGYGTVWKLSPSGSGAYTETILHSFANSPDGAVVFSGLALVNGTLYGATASGGSNPSFRAGTLFSISTSGANYTVLHSFAGSDGQTPEFGKWAIRGNVLFGTTAAGGAGEAGVVFRYEI